MKHLLRCKQGHYMWISGWEEIRARYLGGKNRPGKKRRKARYRYNRKCQRCGRFTRCCVVAMPKAARTAYTLGGPDAAIAVMEEICRPKKNTP